MGRYALIILSNPEDLSEAIKAAHALHYAVGLKGGGGHDVVVYFDGLGSRIPIAQSPYKGLRPAYEEALRAGLIYGRAVTAPRLLT